jgi:hypothetical protein
MAGKAINEPRPYFIQHPNVPDSDANVIDPSRITSIELRRYSGRIESLDENVNRRPPVSLGMHSPASALQPSACIFARCHHTRPR